MSKRKRPPEAAIRDHEALTRWLAHDPETVSRDAIYVCDECAHASRDVPYVPALARSRYRFCAKRENIVCQRNRACADFLRAEEGQWYKFPHEAFERELEALRGRIFQIGDYVSVKFLGSEEIPRGYAIKYKIIYHVWPRDGETETFTLNEYWGWPRKSLDQFLIDLRSCLMASSYIKRTEIREEVTK